MTTSITRSRFLQTLAGLALAPVIATRALGAVKSTPEAPNTLLTGGPHLHRLEKSLGEPLLSHQANQAFVVQGRAILVPSNRIAYPAYRKRDGSITEGYLYAESSMTEWNGTFKRERGCANASYVLADLLTKGAPPEDQHALVDWKAHYHFGVWCDEMIYGVSNADFERRRQSGQGFPASEMDDYASWFPRYQVNVFLQTEEDIANFRGTLWTEFQSWKASDPRYQRSFPGIPHLKSS